MSAEIESTHDMFFEIDIVQHGVPEGAKKVVSQTFWQTDGGYGNMPGPMVVAVQKLGIKFLAELTELGEQFQAEKKAPKPTRGV